MTGVVVRDVLDAGAVATIRSLADELLRYEREEERRDLGRIAEIHVVLEALCPAIERELRAAEDRGRGAERERCAGIAAALPGHPDLGAAIAEAIRDPEAMPPLEEPR